MSMTDAERFFFTGGSHARAAHAIVSASQDLVHMSVPFYLLVGFGLETTLKAAFVHLGGKLKVAKFDIGHDLPMALGAAKDLGFDPAHKDTKWLVETMADAHLNHSFRYLEGDGPLTVGEEATSLAILDALVSQVGQMLYPEHNEAFWIELLNKFDPRSA